MSFSDNERIIKGIAFEKALFKVLLNHNSQLRIESENYKSDSFIQKKFNYEYKCKYDGYIQNKLDLSCFNVKDICAKDIIIEVKAGRIGKDTIDKIYMQFSHVFNDEYSAFVLICSGKKSDKWFEKYKIKCQMLIIDYYDLIRNPIMKKVLNSFDQYIIEENNVLIDDYYPSLINLDNISFALGAGCSINSNISDWDRLSKALGFELLYSIVNIKDSVYKNMHITNELNEKIFSCYEKNSALDAIYQNYINSPVVNQLDYFNSIQKVLYMTYDNPYDANKALMTSINNCISRKKIKEIINYNFDSVLEQNYDNKYSSNKIEISNAKTKIGGCEVHHVHGYIPHDYDGKTHVNSFIFTDKEYYDNMMNPNSNCNQIQNRILSDYNVVFVGVSFTDANMKEILRERMNNSPKNKIFGFLKLPSFDGKGTEIKMMENKYKLIQQNYFNSLGVKILWVKDYDDIPKEIDKIL